MKNNMALFSSWRVIFFCLAGILFLLTLCFEIWQKKWKRLVLDIFVCFMQMPLWLILGFAVLSVFPGLIYSYFSGIWMLIGLLLWITPHSIITVKAIRRKDWFDMVCSLFIISAIIINCILINTPQEPFF